MLATANARINCRPNPDSQALTQPNPLNPLTHITNLIRQSATGPVRLPAPLSWRMLTRDRAAAVQRAILLEYLKTGSTVSRLLTLGIALLFWPFRTAAQAWKLTGQVGGQISPIRSKPAQFFQQLWLAWFHGISPQMYYQMGMVASRAPLRPMEWLQNGHAGLLSRVFREEKTLPEINDKLQFAQVMEAHGVPTPRTIAVFQDGQMMAGLSEADFVREAQRHDGLFVKPVRSSGGKDAILLQRQPGGDWAFMASSPEGTGFHKALAGFQRKELRSIDVCKALLNLSESGEFLVQPRLKNHEQLPSLGGPALMAVRVLSGIGESGVVFLRTVIRLPFKNSVASQHGIDAAVGVASGCLGPVFQDSLDQRFFRNLPPDGPLIEGVKLPLWRDLLAVVEQAHRALPDYAFLGWDVAITPDGPMVLEANGNYGLAGLQKPGPRALIDEQFLCIFEDWAKKIENPVSRPGYMT